MTDLLLMFPAETSTTTTMTKPKKKVHKRVVKTRSIRTGRSNRFNQRVSQPVKQVDFDIAFEEDQDINSTLDDMMIKARDNMYDDLDNLESTELVEPVDPLTRNKLNAIEQHDRKTIKKTSSRKNKKGPGRPRKTPKKEPIPRKGIAVVPTDSQHVIEVLYALPLIFKKIIAFFKSLASSEIQIVFRPTEIVFYAQDHLKKSRIRVRIDADKLHHYYCNKVVDIGVNCRDMELILNKVDKDYTTIILLSTKGSVQKNITVILENEMQIDEIHTIGLIGQYKHINNEEDFVDEDYMIKFKYPSKYFKKTISDINTISSRLCISQESRDDLLEIEYRSKNKKVTSRHVVKKPERICLQSQLRAGENFRVDVKVDYIKPISSAQLADEIWIYVDENKSFMTKAVIDNGAIEIKTLTEIIDGRNASD